LSLLQEDVYTTVAKTPIVAMAETNMVLKGKFITLIVFYRSQK